MSKTPMKTTGAFGPAGRNAFTNKKKSAQPILASHDPSRMQSKYVNLQMS